MNEAITTQVMVFTNGRIAIQLWADEGPYARLNVNLPDEAFADDEIAINWDLDDSVLKSILDLNKFQETDRVVRSGHAVCTVWKVVCPEMLQEAAQLRKQIRRHTSRRTSMSKAAMH
ncbi:MULTISPECIES: hypothetical protein [unclassified Cupriavidus]|uniref:hypothetical protein n=1 Tax=unclassified Cupriavidus TaxID=2640874 RepID=UPI0010F83319|nr:MULTISPECIES: hypothetical protein [unclassified Cupriavidus]QWE98123.1 hypothetical protein KLP38_30100 [Cupriavidus sp. EM10]